MRLRSPVATLILLGIRSDLASVLKSYFFLMTYWKWRKRDQTQSQKLSACEIAEELLAEMVFSVCQCCFDMLDQKGEQANTKLNVEKYGTEQTP